MTIAAGSRLGPYEVLSPIGAGGMGEVYRARDERLKRDVAIKVLPASYSQDVDRLRRFEQEAQAAGGLNHPNITSVYDIGTHEGAPYVVQELLEGETLRLALAGAKLSPRKTIDYALQIAHGLAAAHEKGIVHRDLKPENLFVTRDGRVKILDFGLAKLTHSDSGIGPESKLPTETAGTEPGVVMGTLGYMSPEQVRGAAADARSDIFSFGAILYEMLSGKRAFRGQSAADTMSAILREDPPDLMLTNAAVPPGVERLVRHCLEKSPEARFHSASDLAFQLEAISADSGIGGVSAAAGRPRRLSLKTVVSLGLAAVVAVAAIAYFAGARFGFGRAAPPVSYQRLTFRRGDFVNARFAPDGQTVVYGATWDGQPLEIYQARPGGGELPLGLPGADLLSVSRKGEMAILLVRRREGNQYFKVGTLARVPLNGGTPRELAEDVRAADWAPDGESLAVLREVQGKQRLEFPLGRVLYETFHPLYFPRVSPDGNRVAFIEGEADKTWSVVVVDRSGARRVLSGGWTDWWNIAWSPDGKEVWFGGTKTGEASALYAVTLGGRQRALLEGPGTLEIHDVSKDGRVLLARVSFHSLTWGLAPGEPRERDLTWLELSTVMDLSADGSVLLLNVGSESLGPGPLWGAFLRRMDGSPAVQLGKPEARQLSPDGKWALAIQNGPPPRLLALPTGAGDVRTLKGDFEWIGDARWTPDGKRVVAQAREKGHGNRLHSLDLEGGSLRPISKENAVAATRGDYNVLSPVSPDGRLVAAVAPDGRVVLFPLDGGEPRPAPGLSRNEAPIQWSPDGRRLYAFDRGSLPARVFTVDLDSGRREPVRELMPPDRVGVTDLASVRMTPDGKSYAYTGQQFLSDLYLVEGLK